MKRVTLFLLLFAMCLGVIVPGASLSASAEETSPDYLNVSLVSTNDQLKMAGMNAETVFQNDATVYQAKNTDEGVIIVGKLDGYYNISRITVRTSASLPNRTKGAYIEGSVDGQTWVTLARQEEAASAETCFYLDVTDDSPYLYVRLRQDISFRNYDLGITSLLFEGTPSQNAPVVTNPYLNVSLVSTNDQLKMAGMNAETVFQNDATVYQAKNTDEGVMIVGKLDGYYNISRITIRTSTNLPNRTRGCYLEGSLDGKTWTTLAQQQKTADYADGSTTQYKETWFYLDVADENPYLYVRLRQDIGFKNYDLSIASLLFEGTPCKTLPVAYVESNYDGTNDRNATHCFLNDTSYYSAQGKTLAAGGREPVYGLGKLAEKSRISKVICFAHPQFAGRMRGMTVWASADGEAWDLLATLPNTIVENQRYEFAVEPDTYYQYVKFEQSKATAANSEWFSVGYVLFEGEMFTAESSAVLQGYQRSLKAEDTYSIRFICTLNSLNYQAAGMKIHVTTEDGTVRDFDVKTQTVYRSVTGTIDGVQTEIKAKEEFGSEYIYTVEVQGIPTNLGLTEFTITPYVIANGQTMESATGTVEFRNANPADAAPKEPEQVKATYQSTNMIPNGTSNAATVFGTDKTKYFNRAPVDSTDKTQYYISASFDAPTVITKIIYSCAHASANRARKCYFEASTDGENWVKLATLPDKVEQNTVYTMEVDDSTAYSYIRMVVADGYQTYWITVGVVEVWGIQDTNA